MLKADTTEKLKSFGFDVDKLIAAIKAEAETDYEIPDVQPFTPKDLETRDGIKLAEGKALGEKEARTTFVKEVSKKLGFDPKGERIGDLITEVQNKMNATGDEKVKMLTDQVTALTKDKESLSSEIEQEKSRASQAQFDSQLISFFPPSRSQDLKDIERLTLIKNEITFETVDGKQVAKRNGVVIADEKTRAPLPVDSVVKTYFTERGWDKTTTPPAGGRGGGNNNPAPTSGFKKQSEVKAQWELDNPGKNPMSAEYMNHLQTVVKDVPDFDMYN